MGADHRSDILITMVGHDAVQYYTQQNLPQLARSPQPVSHCVYILNKLCAVTNTVPCGCFDDQIDLTSFSEISLLYKTVQVFFCVVPILYITTCKFEQLVYSPKLQ